MGRLDSALRAVHLELVFSNESQTGRAFEYGKLKEHIAGSVVVEHYLGGAPCRALPQLFHKLAGLAQRHWVQSNELTGQVGSRGYGKGSRIGQSGLRTCDT